MIQSLQKRVAPYLEIICCFDLSGSHLFYIIKTALSDAESYEEQGGSKQKFVEGTTAKLWPNFLLGIKKNTEENENERFKPC